MTGQFFIINRIRLFVAVLFLVAGTSGVSAQKCAIKTNLVSDALASPNIGVEVGLAPKWSLDVTGQINLWNIREHRWRHWAVQPEARYWFCRRFMGHFLGLHAVGGVYNVGNIGTDFRFLGSDFGKLRDRRYEGWAAGLGIAYGYNWVLGRHWGIEAEAGLGWLYTRYSTYPCTSCGRKLESGRHHNYFGPTKAAINIVYYF